MQETEFLIPLLHSPVAKEQCPPLIHHQPCLGKGETTAERICRIPSEPLQLVLANDSEQSCSCPYLFPRHDASGTESLPTESTVAPWPLQNQLFSPGLGGSFTAKLGRGCSVLQEMAFLVLNPRQHVEAVYNQEWVFNVQNLLWRLYLNISSHMQVHGPTDVLAPEHCRAKGMWLPAPRACEREGYTLFTAYSRQDHSMSGCAVRG